jgi:hypothetical protein
MPKYGAYSKEIVLARPDGRTKEARLLHQMRSALFTHLGGEDKLSPPQRVLVERAAMLQLRCAVLDGKVLDATFSEYDAKTYLAFSNSLTRTMEALGLSPTAPAETQLNAIQIGERLEAARRARQAEGTAA